MIIIIIINLRFTTILLYYTQVFSLKVNFEI